MTNIARPTKPLADVNVLPQSDCSHKITVVFMPNMASLYGEGSIKAFLAIDGSVSMKTMYGDGSIFMNLPNYVEAVTRKIGEILTEVTGSRTISAIYWSVGPDGGEVEDIGEFDGAGWKKASIKGPRVEQWGRGSKLLPAIQYIVKNFTKDADWTIGAILTDGIIEDEEECFTFCQEVGRKYEGMRPEPVKLVFIGIGENVDEGQLERFDNMFEGTGIDYDLFSFGVVSLIKEESDILSLFFSDLVSDDVFVAPMGRVEDSKGNVLISWSDGMPGKFEFILPKGEKQFAIKAPGVDIVQDVSEAIS